MTRAIVVALLFNWSAAAQSFDQLKLDHLAAKAKDHTEVTMDAGALQLAGTQLTKNDEAKAKEMLAGLKRLAIRSYEFARDGEYSPADVQQMRGLFQTPGWARVVGMVSKADRESFEIFTKSEGGKASAMALLAAEPKELTLVFLEGTVDIGRLSELGAHFGYSGAKKKGSK